jgi:hypothetical protein
LNKSWQDTPISTLEDVNQHTIFVNHIQIIIRANLWAALNALLDQKHGKHGQKHDSLTATDSESLYTFDGSIQPCGWNYSWIDAICINQLDIRERNHQVKLMKLIYSKAAFVIAWLAPSEVDAGADSDEIRTGLEFMFRWHQRTLAKSEHIYKIHFSRAHAIERNIVCNPYWSRMWIIQEVILARKIVFLYGYVWLNESFWALVCRTHPHGPRGNEGREDVAVAFGNTPASRKIINNRLAYHDPTRSIDVALTVMYEEYAKQMCSDPRDRIYGLLSLMPDDYPIKPDYSLSVVDVKRLMLSTERKRGASIAFIDIPTGKKEAAVVGAAVCVAVVAFAVVVLPILVGYGARKGGRYAFKRLKRITTTEV